MERYVSDAIVDLLTDLGCRYLPLNPGSSFRGLHDSLVNYGPKVGGPEPMLCANEGIAVAAAHAYAKATNSVSFAAIHDLVGLMQGSMGVYNAWCDRAPMVVLGGGGPMDPAQRRPVDWFHSASVQCDLVRDFVKWDDEPATAQATLDAIVRAYRLAGSAPTGPTYVTLDCRIQEDVDDGLTVPDVTSAQPDPPPAARSADIAVAVDALLNADQPVVVAGRVGQDAACTPLLVELGERLGCALRDERNLNALPTRHPQNLNGDKALLREADVILGVELHDLNRLADDLRKERTTPEPAIFTIGQEAAALRSWSNGGRSSVPATTLPASGPVGLAQLIEELRSRGVERGAPERAARVAQLAARHEGVATEARERATEHRRRDGISQLLLVDALWQAVKDRHWLLSLRNHRAWPQALWEFDRGNRFLGHNGGGGVGYGPGALLGGALAARDRGELAVGIIGDGDFQYGTGVLWTALHHRVPMLVVVNNNRSYYNDEEHQVHMAKVRGRPVENAHVAIRLDEPEIDFAKIADGYGAVGIGPVKEASDLDQAFQRGVAEAADGGVAVVDVRTE